MLIEGDAKGLEVFGAAYLSGDKVLCQEIKDGVDIHTANQIKFGFPMTREGRVIAKILKFRIIYGGTEFGFVNDSDFNWLSHDTKFWRRAIDQYYEKYTGIHAWHQTLVRDAMGSGMYTSPTGRQYTYKPYKNQRGEWTWPRTQILNYPVQGFGADLMSIARVSAYRRLSHIQDCLFINSVHDSILLDTPNDVVYDICTTLENVFTDVPKNFTKLFNQPMDLPMSGEIKFGPNWKQMEVFKRHG